MKRHLLDRRLRHRSNDVFEDRLRTGGRTVDWTKTPRSGGTKRRVCRSGPSWKTFTNVSLLLSRGSENSECLGPGHGTDVKWDPMTIVRVKCLPSDSTLSVPGCRSLWESDRVSVLETWALPGTRDEE